MPLGPFLLRRAATSLLGILGVSILVFLFLHLAPGDPVDRLTGGDATEEQRQAMAECMYLDKSWPEQFGIFLKNVGNGTLGRQCPNTGNKPTVMARIAEVLPHTGRLALGGMLVAVILALPLGIFAAIRRGTWTDAFAGTVSLLGISIPTIWMGPLFVFIFYVGLAWLPGPGQTNARFALVLPSIVVGTHLMAMLSRMTRSSLVDVLREDFMQTARAKGLPEWVVIVKHGLRNALLPVVTIVGLQFGSLLSGAIITERVFARPGLGTLLLEGVQERNYPIVQGTVLVIAVAYAAVNLLVDISYGLIDPRVRHA